MENAAESPAAGRPATAGETPALLTHAARRMYTLGVKTPDLTTLLEALGDPTRLRLLNLLRAGDLCVCYLVEVLGDPQPKVSRHLAYLRRVGLVAGRREGKWIHYSLAPIEDASLTQVLTTVLDAAAAARQMQRDRLSLDRACCAIRLPASLQNAPRPRLERGRQS
jgi:ArsR family transcriptional regulator, arsenate/arsenite/antimonite-responsive transcriptional repressor